MNIEKKGTTESLNQIVVNLPDIIPDSPVIHIPKDDILITTKSQDALDDQDLVANYLFKVLCSYEDKSEGEALIYLRNRVLRRCWQVS
jgi:hypothetical protein